MADTIVAEIWEASGADGLVSLLPDGLFAGDGVPDPDTVLQTMSGEAVLSRLWDCILQESGGVLGLSGQLCGTLVLCAVYSRYRQSVGRDDDGLLSHFVTLALALIGFGALAELFADAAGYFSQLHTSVTAALTTLTALSAMRGAVQTAALGSIGMAFFLAVMETVCSGVLYPFLQVCTGLSLASSVSGGVLTHVSGFLRRQFLWLVGGVMMLLCAVLSYQSVLARAADSVTMRAVKFTLSGAIPIIGGAVGEASSAVAAGFTLAQKTVGVLGIAAILWQILPTVCAVLLIRTAFSVSSALASVLGMKSEEGVLSECASLAGFLLAVCIAAAVIYILMLTLCMNGG